MATPVKTYPYRDHRGKLLYGVRRYEPKGFDVIGSGGRVIPDFTDDDGNPRSDHPRPLVLYNLLEIIASEPWQPVFVCEGEKDVESLRQLGHIATTMPGGTRMGWRASYSMALSGRHVIILPDADGPGRRHAAKVHDALLAIAASVIVLDLHAGRSGPMDVSDWLHAGGSFEAAVKTAQYRQVGRDKGSLPKKSKVRLVLAFPGTTNERFLLLTLLEFEFMPVRTWTMSELGGILNLHRVATQRLVSGLMKQGVLRREINGRRSTLSVEWGNVCALISQPLEAPEEPPQPPPEPEHRLRRRRKNRFDRR